MSPRTRSLLLAIGVIAGFWFAAWAVSAILEHNRMTADKVRAFANGADLSSLAPAERAEALRRLEDMINHLSAEERRKWRQDGTSRRWFNEMSESEKAGFIDATMPSGFKQWLTEFDQQPDDRRKKFIDELMAKLKDKHLLATDREPGQTNGMYGTNGPPQLSAQLETRARTLGLKTFYTDSSAETKAELAPILEELQRQMDQGKYAQ